MIRNDTDLVDVNQESVTAPHYTAKLLVELIQRNVGAA
jgi:hypothetical protein